MTSLLRLNRKLIQFLEKSRKWMRDYSLLWNSGAKLLYVRGERGRGGERGEGRGERGEGRGERGEGRGERGEGREERGERRGKRGERRGDRGEGRGEMEIEKEDDTRREGEGGANNLLIRPTIVVRDKRSIDSTNSCSSSNIFDRSTAYLRIEGLSPGTYVTAYKVYAGISSLRTLFLLSSYSLLTLVLLSSYSSYSLRYFFRRD